MSVIISSCNYMLWLLLRYQGTQKPIGCPTVGSVKVQEQQPELQKPCRTKFSKAAARAGGHRLLGLLSDRGSHGEHL